VPTRAAFRPQPETTQWEIKIVHDEKDIFGLCPIAALEILYRHPTRIDVCHGPCQDNAVRTDFAPPNLGPACVFLDGDAVPAGQVLKDLPADVVPRASIAAPWVPEPYYKLQYSRRAGSTVRRKQ